MRKEIGTMRELNLKLGDVVECVYSEFDTWKVGERYTMTADGLECEFEIPQRASLSTFRIISRASEPQKVKIGDEVSVTTDAYHNSCPRGSLGMVVEVGRGFIGAAFNGEYGNDGYPLRLEDGEYELTASDTPKLWRDMTDEEKSSVPDEVLNDPTNPLQIPWGEWTREAKKEVFWANHEGERIERWSPSLEEWRRVFPSWTRSHVYRVKPEPVREKVDLYAGCRRIGTIVLEDGKPDRDSINMEEV